MFILRTTCGPKGIKQSVSPLSLLFCPVDMVSSISLFEMVSREEDVFLDEDVNGEEGGGNRGEKKGPGIRQSLGF